MGEYRPEGRYLVAWFRALSLGLFCFIILSKSEMKYILNNYINDKLKVKTSMLHKEISKNNL